MSEIIENTNLETPIPAPECEKACEKECVKENEACACEAEEAAQEIAEETVEAIPDECPAFCPLCGADLHHIGGTCFCKNPECKWECTKCSDRIEEDQ